MFQVRHIWNHNFGQADHDFIKKTKRDENNIGTRISPSEEEVREFLVQIELLGVKLREKLLEQTQD
jgi:hypothetical protein